MRLVRGERAGEVFFMCPLICKQVCFCGGIFCKEGFEYSTKKTKTPKLVNVGPVFGVCKGVLIIIRKGCSNIREA